MRTALYHGEETNIGRHGIISDGEPICFLQTELSGAINDSRFEFLPDESKSEGLLPVATEQFDLRTIYWGLPVNELDRRLCGLGKHTLCQVVAGMASIGCYMQGTDTNDYLISDDIISVAYRNGWEKLTPEELVQLPGLISVNATTDDDSNEGDGSGYTREELDEIEAEATRREKEESDRLEAERVAKEEQDRIDFEKAEAEREEAERLEAARIEAEKIEAERIEADRIKAETEEAEAIEAKRLAAEKDAQEKVDQEAEELRKAEEIKAAELADQETAARAKEAEAKAIGEKAAPVKNGPARKRG